MPETQINPPFDGSAPCPACQQELRNVSALIHNLLTRTHGVGEDGLYAYGVRPEGKFWVRLYDLAFRTTIPEVLTVHSDEGAEILACAHALREAAAGMTSEGLTIRWTPEVVGRVTALIPRLMAAADAWDQICDAHFRDQRHSHGPASHDGGRNVIRESEGWGWAGLVKTDPPRETHYKHTVEIVTEGADITHGPCGSGLKLSPHFTENMARDPTFYGAAWCPACRGVFAIGQFSGDLLKA